MKQQFIISLGREFGSGGHVIAEELSKRFSVPLYDYDLLRKIAEERHLDVGQLEKYDERPKSVFGSRTIKGYSNSPAENIAELEFDYLRKKAESGESFIIVGRCAEEVLKAYDCLVTIFILGDREAKVERICQLHNVSRAAAETMIHRQDRKRKMYHNYYCSGKWGDSRNYDISINSSKLGINQTVDVLERYIRQRIQ